jgi:hypothetical protein
MQRMGVAHETGFTPQRVVPLESFCNTTLRASLYDRLFVSMKRLLCAVSIQHGLEND